MMMRKVIQLKEMIQLREMMVEEMEKVEIRMETYSEWKKKVERSGWWISIGLVPCLESIWEAQKREGMGERKIHADIDSDQQDGTCPLKNKGKQLERLGWKNG